MERKNYLDNIRWMTVGLVMLYHVIYIFNSQGVLSNFGIQGIAKLDGFLYLVYPWFMALLFVVAGVSAKYALEKRTNKEFLKDRVRRLLVPSIFVMLFFGWICGSITNYYSDMFGGNGDKIPGVVKYLIYSLSGIGPMWFAQELFLASIVLVLVRKIDKQNRLEILCKNMKWWGFFILFLSFWVSSWVFNTPIIEVYRNGIYVNCFLMGYYVFSNEAVIDMLQSAKKYLTVAAFVCAIAYYGYIKIVIEPQATDNILTSVNYTTMSVLKNGYTNLYAWVAILAIFSVAKDWLNFQNQFTTFMTKANFGYYALHYPCLAVVAFFSAEKMKLPIGACYVVNFFGMIVLTSIMYIVISRIPVLRTLILGIPAGRTKNANKGSDK